MSASLFGGPAAPGFGRGRLSSHDFGRGQRSDGAGNGKEATARSDAVSAVGEGKSSKGVKRVAGKATGSPPPSSDGTGSGTLETRRTPGWQRGATDPRPHVWRKPSRWRETTRAERVCRFGSVGPKGACSLEWTPRGMSAEGSRRSSREEDPSRDGTNALRSASKRRSRSGGSSFRLRSGRPPARETLEGPAGNGERSRRAVGKTNDPLPTPAAGAAQRSIGRQRLRRP